jgi:hypothetical protein
MVARPAAEATPFPAGQGRFGLQAGWDVRALDILVTTDE